MSGSTTCAPWSRVTALMLGVLVPCASSSGARAAPEEVLDISAPQVLPSPGPLRTSARLGLALGPAFLGAYDARAGHGRRGMAQSQLALALPLGELGAFDFGAELLGRFGVVPASGGTALVGLVAGLRAGFAPANGLDVGLSVRVAHIHDAPHSAWVDHTSETLAGDPSWGLAHITAGGVAVGLAWEIPGLDGRVHLTAEVELLGRLHGHGERGLPRLWLSAPVGVAFGL